MYSFDFESLYTTAGLIGVLCYILAYLGLQTGQLRGGTVPHTGLNLLAATLVLTSLLHEFNLSAAVIQIIWIVISLFGLGRIWYLHTTTRLTEEEAAFINAKLPQLSRPMARRFLDAGQWRTGTPGEVLAVEGRVLGTLIYMAEGSAQVTSDGVKIATCGPGNLIGELTFLSGEPATATVTLDRRARYFSATQAALAGQLRRDSALRLCLEQALSREARLKLLAANNLTRAGHGRPLEGSA